MQVRRVWQIGSAATLALWTLAGSISAQEVPRSIALDRFDPSPAGDMMLGIPNPTVASGISPSIGVMAVYARDPLVAVHDDDHSLIGRVVSHQLNIHAMAAIDLAAIAKIHVDVPFMASQSGNEPQLDGKRVASPKSAVMGDVRTGLRLSLVQQQNWIPSIAANASIWFPTGKSDAFTSTGRTRYALQLITGSDHDAFLWRVAIGRHQGHDDRALEGYFASQATLSAGAAMRFGPCWVGPELHSSTASGNGMEAFGRSSTQLEALLTGFARLGDFAVGAGAGPGLTHGLGTPSFRGILSVSYSPKINWTKNASSRDPRDNDPTGSAQGQQNTSDDDTSPRVVSLGRNAPPGTVADTDGDGIPDDIDPCPTVVGVPDGPRPGCPLDTDGDGIPDAEDACPTTPGVPSAVPEHHGCPRDTDGDGIPDHEDACPNERGARTEDPTTNGCPESVRIVGTQIVISNTILFATGKDEVAVESNGLLAEIVRVLEDHPEIARVAVDGHTDNVGSERNNLALSRRRAVAVVRWLVDHGVDERRLEARGFGPRRPLVPNTTPEARAKNRRVEFQILRRTKLGSVGWSDGGVSE